MATRAAAPTHAAPTSGPTMGMPGTAEVTAKAAHENFPVASLLLPPSLRRPLLGIYGFARLTDDIGDEAGGDRSALLDWLEADVGRMYGGEPIHPLLRRLAPSVRALGLPRRPFLRLIEANRQDQKVSRYETYADLAAYCELSANPVGELVLHVFRAASADRIRLSDAVCTGLQLAEHWQDVGEDFRRGRVYLPQEDLAAFGVPEEDLGASTASERLKRLMAFEVARARGLLEQGGELVGSLGGWARLAVAGYVAGGKAALGAVERSGYEVVGEPPRATRASRAAAIGRELGESL
jgi:squalene synthase HpnC